MDDGRMVGWMDDDESVDDGQMMAGQTDVWVDGWISDGRMDDDGWVDDGWTGRWMDDGTFHMNLKQAEPNRK